MHEVQVGHNLNQAQHDINQAEGDIVKGNKITFVYQSTKQSEKEKQPIVDIFHLPKPTTALIGRKTELDQLTEAFTNPNIRLAIIVAAGGRTVHLAGLSFRGGSADLPGSDRPPGAHGPARFARAILQIIRQRAKR